jgi:hypothetical protein
MGVEIRYWLWNIDAPYGKMWEYVVVVLDVGAVNVSLAGEVMWVSSSLQKGCKLHVVHGNQGSGVNKRRAETAKARKEAGGQPLRDEHH